MFDLDPHLHQWRQELEATLAFSSEEIDELEDHLRISLDAKLKEGLSPDAAWTSSLGSLGSASALALEFAKDKLLPALWRLLISWWRPACLMVLFSAIYGYSFSSEPATAPPGQPQHQEPVSQMPVFWILTTFGLLLPLILLPNKAHKNAILAGIGNAFCLIPLLHLLIYNSVTEKFVGPGWSHMAASFPWTSIPISLAALVIINVWWHKRSPAIEANPSSPLAIAGMLILVLALSPFISELIGNLSIRDLYSMPSPSSIPYSGNVRDHFSTWTFVAILVRCVFFITNILPFSLALVICTGICFIHVLTPTEFNRDTSQDEPFPSPSSLLWLMTLLGSGLCWIVGHTIEINFSRQLRSMTEGPPHAPSADQGLEIMVLLSSTLFFICAWELTRQLARASRIRPFYASLLVVFESGVLILLVALPFLDNALAIRPDPLQITSQPKSLSWILNLSLLSIAFYQTWLITRKLRLLPGAISLWRFEGRNLMETGLLLGLIFAGTWLIMGMVAIVLAYESGSVIYAMIDWQHWIQNPIQTHFHPETYGTPDHLAFWTACGITYLSFCLTSGLFVIIAASGLEFIRFNSFRLYKVRKIRQAVRVIATND